MYSNFQMHPFINFEHNFNLVHQISKTYDLIISQKTKQAVSGAPKTGVLKNGLITL